MEIYDVNDAEFKTAVLKTQRDQRKTAKYRKITKCSQKNICKQKYTLMKKLKL